MSGLWERRAGTSDKPEQVPQGASGRGFGTEERYYIGTDHANVLPADIFEQ
jgi:hypothetical protein